MISNDDYLMDIKDRDFLLEVAIGYTKSISLSIALKLNIPQLLQSGPKSCEELAKITNTHSENLYRLLRTLSTIGIFIEDEEKDGVFSNSRLSLLLTNTSNSSWINNIYLQSHPNVIKSFMYLEKTIETGESHGMTSQGFSSAWEMFELDTKLKSYFHNTMTCFTQDEINTILKYIDFNEFESVVDLGGSTGVLLKAIAKSKNGIKVRSFTNFDLPHVISQNKQDCEDDRYSDVSGDFFILDSIPKADCYTLKFILHMFNDDKVLSLLENLKRSIDKNGKVYIFDHIVQPKNTPSAPFYFDLQMILNFNGKERSVKEWKDVIDRSPFKINSIRVLSDNKRMSLIELSLK
ncbi:hypothetical protein DICPUDRAFT_52923 [Dictyostelium purpureum]|uniref:O-methyltransferase domain-containing protein n=1 Tax=Dictyostelium purpureum TaxID=5786 RepID=F0ZAI4_DICPU|nr:uncharacterized protein DICPUDRAFT_52923 [Dictyostelium purpureum]EGC39053.1 hypothetical protein DICPUDRAFT_52923 [Dictyostelium purpureum]|eukprot:XP_003284403.1 hypothetical protein DICPUDRAFT_52923 [Dictyostelium purpureum]